MPPKHGMEEWGKEDTKYVNNCYNYATDNLNHAESEDGKPTPNVHPATPGKLRDASLFISSLTKDEKGTTVAYRLTCRSLKGACLRDDGMHAIEGKGHCKRPAHEECWRIAYFVKNDTEGKMRNGVRYLRDSFHFAREDRKATDSAPAKWSHKCCWDDGHGATDKCITTVHEKDKDGNVKLDYGDPITDPATQEVKPGYKWCGYLCCCPDARVAHVDPSELHHGDEALVAMYAYDGESQHLPVFVTSSLFAKLDLPAPCQNWGQGFGPGNLIYRFDRIDPDG